MPWLTEETDPAVVRAYWPTVDEVDPEALARLLSSAREQVEAFAPSLTTTVDGVTTTAEPPDRYLMAQAMQARALWRSANAGPHDGMGGEGFTVTVFPMDWTVKALLRPQRGRPAIA